MINKKFKFGAKVYIFADFREGLPHVFEGRIVGLTTIPSGIYKYVYQVETSTSIYFRFPDAIFESVDEAAAMIKDLVC